MTNQTRPVRARFNPWRLLRYTLTWGVPTVAYLAVVTWAFARTGWSVVDGLVFAVAIVLGGLAIMMILFLLVARFMDLLEALQARERGRSAAELAAMRRHPSAQRSSGGGPSARGVNPDSWA